MREHHGGVKRPASGASTPLAALDATLERLGSHPMTRRIKTSVPVKTELSFQSQPIEWFRHRGGRGTDDTALNYMRVYELSKNRNFRDLDLSDMAASSLYELAKPSTPPEALEEVAERVKGGNAPKVEEVKTIVAKVKGKPTKLKPMSATSIQARKKGEPDPRCAQSAMILKNFVEEYRDLSSWTKVISTINGALMEQGQHSTMLSPFNLADHIKILVERYGWEQVSDAVLECHRP
jgi:hypothetical protein